MDIPEGILCTGTHEWVILQDDLAFVGLCDLKINSMGDIVEVDLPDVGSSLEKFETFATVESVRQAYELSMPVSGTIVEVNEKLINSPELVNEAPFESWFIKVDCDNYSGDTEGLMEYSDYVDDFS